MARNLFITEEMMEYRLQPSRPNYGEWVDRNGVPAMSIGPLPYYTGGTYAYVQSNKFEAGKQYVFDIYIDTDACYSSGKWQSAGIVIRYSDGTTTNCYTSSKATSGESGWQHKTIVTTAGKDVSGFTVYYGTSIAAYYRYDSTITEYEPQSIEKTGIADVGYTREGNYDNASFVKGGGVYTNGLYET